MQNLKSLFADSGRGRAQWAALLVAASVGFTFGFACAVPFAAFGAVAALTLSRRDALLLTAALWLVNQAIGYTFLHYPWDGLTLVWGIVLGIVTVLATAAAQVAIRGLGRRGIVAAALTGFAAAFVVYEGGLYVVAAGALGGTEVFAAAIVLRILEINAAAFLGLLLTSWLVERLGLFAGAAAMRGTAARHA